MRLQIFLTMVCMTLKISQSLKPTRTYNENDSRKLSFEEDLPRNLNINNANISSYGGQTNSQQEQSQPHDKNNKLQNQYQSLHQNNNLQNTNLNQFIQNSNLDPNSKYQFQHSLELLPPSHTSENYYTSESNLKSSETGDGERYNTQPNVLPLYQSSLVNTTLDMRIRSTVISHIGIFMMKSARGNQSNVVVSPMSVVNMLALLQAGATGVTQEQVSNALRLTPEQSAEVFQLINTDFRKRGNQRNILRLATSIFAADSFELSRDFKNFAVQNFGSEISKIRFDNPNLAAQKINSWIASKTNNKIDKVLSPDSIGVNTQLVLANAIYFKGIWETMFKPAETSPQDFHTSNGNKKSVPFMSLRSGFRAGLDKANKALVVVLPFENNQYSLVMLLPVPDADLTAVLAGLNGDTLADYQNMRRQDVLLQIPKFTVRSNTNLQPLFTKMGVTKMFSQISELSNIGVYRSSSPQVSSAVHSAMMSIDEQGATAAASTVVAVVALSFDNPSVVFRADRPFLAVLWDNQLNVPLFMTMIEDPSM